MLTAPCAAPPAAPAQVVEFLSSAANLRAAKPQEVFNTLWGLAHLRHHPQQALPVVVDYAVQMAPRLRPVDLANLLVALGTLSHHPGAAAMGRLLQRVDSELERLSAAELANCYWGLALIEETGSPLYARMTSELQRAHEEGRLSEALQRQFFTGFLAAKLGGAAVSLPPPVLEALKAAWIAGVHASEPSEVLESVARQLRCASWAPLCAARGAAGAAARPAARALLAGRAHLHRPPAALAGRSRCATT